MSGASLRGERTGSGTRGGGREPVEPRQGERAGSVRFATWAWRLANEKMQWSPEVVQILGLEPAGEGIPEPALETMLSAMHPQDRDRVGDAMTRALRTRSSFSVQHRVVVASTRAVRTIHQEGYVAADRRGAPVLRCVMVDMTEQARSEAQVRSVAHYDSVTGLPNGVLFRELLNHALSRAQRTGGKVAVLLVGVDRFTSLVSGLEQSVLDQILRVLALRISRSLRKSDFMGRKSQLRTRIARQGGSEFVIVLDDLRRDEDVLKIAQRILNNIAQPLRIDTRDVLTTASVGIATTPVDGTELRSLVNGALVAMTRAAEDGGNCFRTHLESINQRAAQNLDIEARMRASLRRNGFTIAYQPIVRSDTKTITGVEALLRWNDQGGLPISTSEFIAVAEESGLIVELGRFVIEKACATAARWTSRSHGLTLAINVASRQLRDPSFLTHLTSVLAETGFPATQLELELTERSVIRDDRETADVLRQLKALGVRIAVDDFGTGYSAFAYLKAFPVDTIKIDRSFVQGIQTDATDRAITGAMIALADGIGLRTIAEGVECDAELQFLVEKGCAEVQGYLFSVPLAAFEIDALLAHDDGTTGRRAGGIFLPVMPGAIATA